MSDRHATSQLRMGAFALAALAVTFGVGLFTGWFYREEAAMEACRQAEGKWQPHAGYCVAPKLGDMQP